MNTQTEIEQIETDSLLGVVAGLLEDPTREYVFGNGEENYGYSVDGEGEDFVLCVNNSGEVDFNKVQLELLYEVL